MNCQLSKKYTLLFGFILFISFFNSTALPDEQACRSHYYNQKLRHEDLYFILSGQQVSGSKFNFVKSLVSVLQKRPIKKLGTALLGHIKPNEVESYSQYYTKLIETIKNLDSFKFEKNVSSPDNGVFVFTKKLADNSKVTYQLFIPVGINKYVSEFKFKISITNPSARLKRLLAFAPEKFIKGLIGRASVNFEPDRNLYPWRYIQLTGNKLSNKSVQVSDSLIEITNESVERTGGSYLEPVGSFLESSSLLFQLSDIQKFDSKDLLDAAYISQEIFSPSDATKSHIDVNELSKVGNLVENAKTFVNEIIKETGGEEKWSIIPLSMNDIVSESQISSQQIEVRGLKLGDTIMLVDLNLNHQGSVRVVVGKITKMQVDDRMPTLVVDPITGSGSVVIDLITAEGTAFAPISPIFKHK